MKKTEAAKIVTERKLEKNGPRENRIMLIVTPSPSAFDSGERPQLYKSLSTLKTESACGSRRKYRAIGNGEVP
jgi:hypothetical protein